MGECAAEVHVRVFRQRSTGAQIREATIVAIYSSVFNFVSENRRRVLEVILLTVLIYSQSTWPRSIDIDLKFEVTNNSALNHLIREDNRHGPTILRLLLQPGSALIVPFLMLCVLNIGEWEIRAIFTESCIPVDPQW